MGRGCNQGKGKMVVRLNLGTDMGEIRVGVDSR